MLGTRIRKFLETYCQLLHQSKHQSSRTTIHIRRPLTYRLGSQPGRYDSSPVEGWLTAQRRGREGEATRWERKALSPLGFPFPPFILGWRWNKGGAIGEEGWRTWLWGQREPQREMGMSANHVLHPRDIVRIIFWCIFTEPRSKVDTRSR